MVKAVSLLTVFYLAAVALSGCVTIESSDRLLEPLAASPTFATSVDPLAPPTFAETEHSQAAIAPMSETLSWDLGIQVLNVKASFFEKKNPLDGALQSDASRHYFNVLATSQPHSGGLQTEGEFSYSMLDGANTQCHCDEQPRLLRLTVKDRWAGFNFGADYRSLGKGFVFVTGETVAQSREEAQMWSERAVGPFNFRGTVGQSWEHVSDVNELRLTRTASARVNLNRPAWGAGWISTFSLVGQESYPRNDSTVFSQTLTGTYRPLSELSLASNFSIKQERNLTSGIRTDTPGAGFTILYKPLKEPFVLTSSASYSRSFSAGGLANNGKLGVTTGINWKLGRSATNGNVLSLNVKYNRDVDWLIPSASRRELTGMLQLKIAGF